MKKFTLSALAVALLLLPCLRSFADVALLDTEKNKLQLYGFFKLDAVYQDAGVNGLTIPRYAVSGDGNLYLSATHSRFGFKYTGTPLSNGMNLSAVLEWDFLDTTSPNQMKPRFRQGYFSLQKNGHTLLFGQAWDLFSPLGPTTLMTNGYLWQTGNLGFRHAQVRYSYSAPAPRFRASRSTIPPPAAAGAPRCRSCRGAWGSSWARTTSSSSASRASTAGKTPAATTVPFKNKINISGLGLDWNLVLCKHLSLKGEYAMGENLSYVSSRSAWYADAAGQEFVGQESVGLLVGAAAGQEQAGAAGWATPSRT